MPIPIQKGLSAKRAKEIKRLQRQQHATTKRVRRLLLLALHWAKEAEAGVEGAAEERDALLEHAVNEGLAPDAIKSGNAMVSRISAVLDRPPSQSHALGLLLAAAELVGDFDADKAASIQAIADTLDTSGDHETWRRIANPHREPPII